MAVKPYDSGQRRLVYGLNVAFTVAVFAAIVALVIALAGIYGGQVDLTLSGVNSLSSRTEKLLRGLDRDVRITAIYPVASERIELQQKRQDTMRDLVALYDAAGGARVTARVVDPYDDEAALRDIERRLREKPAYADEAGPQREVVEASRAFLDTVPQLMQAEMERLQAVSQMLPGLQRDGSYLLILYQLQTLEREAQFVKEELERMLGTASPRYGRAVEEVRAFLTSFGAALEPVRQWLSGETGQRPTGGDPQAFAMLDAAADAFRAPLAQANELQTRLNDLPEPELQQLLDQLTNWATEPPVLVETDDAAEVVAFADVWPFRAPDQPPGGGVDPRRDFAGERAVSSAVLRLTQTERTGVVFVRWGGQPLLRPDQQTMQMMLRSGQLPRAPLQQLDRALRGANFETVEWDLQATVDPPAIDAARRVFLVLAPEPAPPPAPGMPPTDTGPSAAQRDALYAALADAAGAVFFAGSSPETSPMRGPAPGYPYDDYLRAEWGLATQTDALVMAFAPTDDGLYQPALRAQSLLGLSMLTRQQLTVNAHPITAPLEGEQVAFPVSAPVAQAAVATTQPSAGDTTYTTLLAVEGTDRIWAVSDLVRLQQDFRQRFGTTPGPDATMAPFALAIAAERDGGRLVLMGSQWFMFDQVAFSEGVMLTGTGFRRVLTNPANLDLLLNSIYWITNDADRIAVGPRESAAPTLTELTDPGMVQFWKIFLVGVWPALALVAGGAMWLVRRS